MGEQATQPAGEPGSQLAQVCAGVARVFSERLGRGPRKCRASWAGRDVILVLLDDAHTTAEQTLRASGHPNAVLGGRRLMLRAIEEELRELVALATGRPVTAVLTATRLDPDVSAEIFVLAPPAATP